LEAAVLGEWPRFSLPVMLESGVLIYPSESNSIMRYHRRLKAKSTQIDTSLFDEAVTALSTSMTPFLGASYQAFGGTVVQSSPKPGGGVVGKSPPSSFLQRGFLLPSVPSPLSGYAYPIAFKGVIFKSDSLIQSQK